VGSIVYADNESGEQKSEIWTSAFCDLIKYLVMPFNPTCFSFSYWHKWIITFRVLRDDKRAGENVGLSHSSTDIYVSVPNGRGLGVCRGYWVCHWRQSRQAATKRHTQKKKMRGCLVSVKTNRCNCSDCHSRPTRAEKANPDFVYTYIYIHSLAAHARQQLPWLDTAVCVVSGSVLRHCRPRQTSCKERWIPSPI
jgi:hypothetical protein